MALQYKTTKEHTITVTGYEGTIRHLVIPDQVDGCPVKTIGKNAFSAREDLESVSIPKTVETLGRYAFYNCKKLKSISLYDSVEDYYDGVIKQCHCLEEVKLTQLRGDYSVMKELLADTDRRLHFRIEPCGLQLTFPAYVYNFVEDVEARVLHHKIEGSGYPYRECVTRKGVDLLAYDRLFAQVVNDDYRTAIEIACDRLMHPIELENHLREQYEQYLEQNAEVILKVLIPENKVEEISYLCDSCLIPEAALADATGCRHTCRRCRDQFRIENCICWKQLITEYRKLVVSAVIRNYRKCGDLGTCSSGRWNRDQRNDWSRHLMRTFIFGDASAVLCNHTNCFCNIHRGSAAKCNNKISARFLKFLRCLLNRCNRRVCFNLCKRIGFYIHRL